MLISPKIFHSQAYKKDGRMSPRQGQSDHENKREATTKIQEKNLNVGLMNFQQFKQSIQCNLYYSYHHFPHSDLEEEMQKERNQFKFGFGELSTEKSIALN